MDWIKIEEHGYPKDGERVIVWNRNYNDFQILVYNEMYECWDDEEGDDFYDNLNTERYPAYCRIEDYEISYNEVR